MTEDVHTIYIISGPLGAGKTSVSKAVTALLETAVRIEGDVFWLATEHLEQFSWAQRLECSWENIVAVTKNYLQRDVDVVIDFVVEDELKWFVEQFSGTTIQIKYIAMIADEKTLTERLEKRGDLKYLGRSLKLLKQISDKEENQQYLYDTTDKTINNIARSIIDDDTWIVLTDS